MSGERRLAGAFSPEALGRVLAALPGADRYRVAYSGGADSLALLHGLTALRERLAPARVDAIHVHHGLHPDADRWTVVCRDVCGMLGVPLQVLRVDALHGRAHTHGGRHELHHLALRLHLLGQAAHQVELGAHQPVGVGRRIGDGVEDEYDQCPEENATALDLNGDGCLDDADGDGVLDPDDACSSTGLGQTVTETGCSDAQLSLLDSDGDGVSDLDDTCPGTPEGTTVDAFGCELQESEGEDEATSEAESFFSGGGTVTTTLGVSAVLLALFTLLQTNAAAALLPDAFRWVQVLRKNSKLTKEERNELTYLQSIVQAYYNNPQELVDELNQLKGDLTGRYTNNEIKKQTREKLFTLIEDLLASSQRELYQIAHNDAYFGLAGSIDSKDRTKLLNEKLAMSEGLGSAATNQVYKSANQPSLSEPPVHEVGSIKDGYEWLEWPQNSGVWWYRGVNSNALWQKWQ